MTELAKIPDGTLRKDLAEARRTLEAAASRRGNAPRTEAERSALLETAREARATVDRLSPEAARREAQRQAERSPGRLPEWVAEKLKPAKAKPRRRKLSPKEEAAEAKRRQREDEIAAIKAEEAAVRRAELEAAKVLPGPPVWWSGEGWRHLAVVLGSRTLSDLVRGRGESGRLDPVLTSDDFVVTYWALTLLAEADAAGEDEAWVNRRYSRMLAGWSGSLTGSLKRLEEVGLLSNVTQSGDRLSWKVGPVVARIVAAFDAGKEPPRVERQEETDPEGWERSQQRNREYA